MSGSYSIYLIIIVKIILPVIIVNLAVKITTAMDLAPSNICVNTISIGPTGSPVGQKDYPDRKRVYESPGIPCRHIGLPEDVANAISFLISDIANYIIGAIIPVDGGGNISR